MNNINQKKHSPNTGEKCKCRNTKSPIATIRFWNANCPIHTESEVKKTKPSQQECKHGEDTICVTCAKQVQLQQKIPFWKQHPEIWDTHCPTCDGMFKGTRGLAIHRKKLCRKYPHPTKKGYCCACDYDIAGFEQALSQQQKEVEDRVRREMLDKMGRLLRCDIDGYSISEDDWDRFEMAVLTSIEEKGGKG